MYQSRDDRTPWLLGGLLSVFALSAVSIEIAHSRLPAKPPVFAEVHVDAPLLKLLAGSPRDFEDDLQTHADLITRHSVLKAALQRPEVADLAIVKVQEPNGVPWLARQVMVEAHGPKTLRIIFKGKPSREAAIVVNGLAAAYIDEILLVTARLRAERIDELERAHRDIDHRLAEIRKAVSRLVKLVSSAATSPSPDAESSNQDQVTIWTDELEILKGAVVEGEEIDEQLKSDLAKLKIPPTQSGVGIIRMAEIPTFGRKAGRSR
jgi:hypothetical protein